MGAFRTRLLVPLLAATMLLPLAVVAPPQAGPGTFYVAPDGNDANGCTFSAPCATINRAVQLVGPGDIVYLRGGEYNVTAIQRIEVSGTASEPVTFAAYPGESPFLNATHAPLGAQDPVVKIVTSNYVTVRGLHVCCSSGRGISISDTTHVTVAYNTVWEVWDRAIGGHGEEVLIANNVIDRAVLQHEDRAPGGGWANALGTYSQWDGSPSRNVTIVGNIVTRSYGECINVLRVVGFVVRDNFADGCFSVDMYVDKSTQGLIMGNVLQSTIPGFEWVSSGVKPNGLMFAAESAPVQIPPSHIAVAWNVIGPGVDDGIKWWDDPSNTEPWNTYRDLTIVNNRIVGVESHAIEFPKVPVGRDPPCCSTFSWNTIDGDLSFGDPGAWMVQGNGPVTAVPPTPPRLDNAK